MEKNTGKKVVTQGKHREFYLGWNVATLVWFALFLPHWSTCTYTFQFFFLFQVERGKKTGYILSKSKFVKS